MRLIGPRTVVIILTISIFASAAIMTVRYFGLGGLKPKAPVAPNSVRSGEDTPELTAEDAQRNESLRYDIRLSITPSDYGVTLNWRELRSGGVEFFDVYRKPSGVSGWGERISRLPIFPENRNYTTVVPWTKQHGVLYIYFVFGIHISNTDEIRAKASNPVSVAEPMQ